MVLKHSDKGGEQKYRYIQYVPQLGIDGRDGGRMAGGMERAVFGHEARDPEDLRRWRDERGGRVTVRWGKECNYKGEKMKVKKK